jgi:hypothetical protein
MMNMSPKEFLGRFGFFTAFVIVGIIGALTGCGGISFVFGGTAIVLAILWAFGVFEHV